MSRDLLKDATQALSESGHEQRGAHFTRERLMASLHESKRRHRSRFTVLLPLAAVFVGSTAFATVTGKLEAVVVSALNIVGIQADSGEQPPPASAAGRVGPSSKAVPSKAGDPAPPPPVDESPAADEAEPGASADADEVAGRAAAEPGVRGASVLRPVPAARDARTADRLEGATTEVSQPIPTEADDAHAVYRRAHHAQFRDDDSARALAGYEEYLARQPGGRFAVDARYNRALCLVRLGRVAEARSVLDAFAGGAFGGYRQRDAARLLLALGEAEHRSRVGGDK